MLDVLAVLPLLDHLLAHLSQVFQYPHFLNRCNLLHGGGQIDNEMNLELIGWRLPELSNGINCIASLAM